MKLVIGNKVTTIEPQRSDMFSDFLKTCKRDNAESIFDFAARTSIEYVNKTGDWSAVMNELRDWFFIGNDGKAVDAEVVGIKLKKVRGDRFDFMQIWDDGRGEFINGATARVVYTPTN